MIYLFVARPTKQASAAQGFLRWVQGQERSLDMPGVYKNASERIRSGGDGPLRLEEWVSLAHKMQLLCFPGSRIKQFRPTKSHQTQIRSQTNRRTPPDGQEKTRLRVLKNDIRTNQNFSLKMTHKIRWDFEIQTDHPIQA